MSKEFDVIARNSCSTIFVKVNRSTHLPTGYKKIGTTDQTSQKLALNEVWEMINLVFTEPKED